MTSTLPPKRSLAQIIADRKASLLAAKETACEAPRNDTSLATQTPPLSSLSLASPISGISGMSSEARQAPPSSPTAQNLSTATQNLSSPQTDALLIAENLKALDEAQILAEEADLTLLPASQLSETFSLSIILNEKQTLAKNLAFSGKSFCLIGAAGTGKTATQREIAAELLKQGTLRTHSFRIQGSSPTQRVDAPSIAFVAYTRIAAGNLRRAIHKDENLEKVFAHNITTIHNLLEYSPETYFDYETQEERFRFVPKRTASNPLDVTHLVIEESSMVGLDLWAELYAALRPGVQIIFIGDINQLPPVFGASILNYALIQLPIVELTHVYRQKEGSSILDNAHSILKGEAKLIEDANFKIIRGGTVQFTQAKMALALSASLKKWHEVGEYDPDQDIILSPFNKQDLGTDSMNKYIAQFLGDKRNAVVFEIICGINKVYLAVGDKVLYNKQVGFVKEIRKNGQYIGRTPKHPSENLSRFGVYTGALTDEDDAFELASYENISLEEIAAQAEEGEKKRQASHIVTLEMETGIIEVLEAVGDFNPQSFTLGYALTVHKAQGCEWRKVFLILHKDHSIMAFRELLYTAVTRAREHISIIAKDHMIAKAIATQRIKGNSLAEKVAFFNAGLMSQENVPCTK